MFYCLHVPREEFGAFSLGNIVMNGSLPLNAISLNIETNIYYWPGIEVSGLQRQNNERIQLNDIL